MAVNLDTQTTCWEIYQKIMHEASCGRQREPLLQLMAEGDKRGLAERDEWATAGADSPTRGGEGQAPSGGNKKRR